MVQDGSPGWVGVCIPGSRRKIKALTILLDFLRGSTVLCTRTSKLQQCNSSVILEYTVNTAAGTAGTGTYTTIAYVPVSYIRSYSTDSKYNIISS